MTLSLQAMATSAEDDDGQGLQEVVRPLLKILRQQGSSWRARIQSGLRCAAPALYLRALIAIRDYARTTQASWLEEAAEAIVVRLQALQREDASVDAQWLDALEQAVEAIAALLEEGQPRPHRGQPSAAPVQDQLDTLLLPIFVEETQDLMNRIGDCLQASLRAASRSSAGADGAGAAASDQKVTDELARYLHTIKGSARMVGALRLSQCLHEMESVLRHSLQRGRGAGSAIDLSALQDLFAQALDHFAALEQSAAMVSAAREQGPQLPAPVVRIKTTVLDRLLNQVGEVALARAHLDTEVAALQQECKAIGEHLATLGEQLSQLQQSRQQLPPRCTALDTTATTPHAFAAEARIDPHTLSRQLAAQLEQASQRHRQLLATVGRTREGLRQQGRCTRELQQELMSARMVRFDSVEARLHHLVRQVAIDTGKSLQLELSGNDLQIDRAILERLMGPLEHLLRNAAVHGIEEPVQRAQSGKPLAGQLRVQARHEGNEAVIRISDDGRGLDLAAIRRKALQLGLPGAATASEAALAEYIFAPGLSTSTQLSTLAGRGIGMDVVRADVAALGGWISVQSRPALGVTLTLCLPLSLAVQHVCLLQHGQQHYAIASMLIDSVIHLRGEAAARAREQGVLQLQGDTLPLRPLHDLLDQPRSDALPPADTFYVLLIKKGDGLMAIMADQVSGNREVVVKPVGPQLSALAGVVGATLLGDGKIVLILHPLLLEAARRCDDSDATRNVQ